MSPANSQLHSWETYGEETTAVEDSSSFAANGLLEQLNVTRDGTDYLWYTTRYSLFNFFDILGMDYAFMKFFVFIFFFLCYSILICIN